LNNVADLFLEDDPDFVPQRCICEKQSDRLDRIGMPEIACSDQSSCVKSWQAEIRVVFEKQVGDVVQMNNRSSWWNRVRLLTEFVTEQAGRFCLRRESIVRIWREVGVMMIDDYPARPVQRCSNVSRRPRPIFSGRLR